MADALRVLELRSVRGTGGGPEKTILQGAAGHDPSRVRVTVCYVRDARDEVFHIDRRAASLGVDYVEVPERHSFDVRVFGRLRALAAERGIRVVHSHDYKTDLLAWLLARRTGVGTLATAHGWTGHSARERLLYYPAHKRLLARFPMVIAVSSEIRQELLARGCRPHRVRVVLNGIDPDAFRRAAHLGADVRRRFGVRTGEIAIGTMGRLEPQKRFDMLVDVFSRLRHRHPRLRLLIAGEGSQRAGLEAQIGSLGLGEGCRLLGHVDDVVGFHHALDLFVQSSAYEGTPNVVLEAMALETPVVATDAGGTAEVCRPDVDGLIVPVGDESALERAIETALADPDARDARVRSARSRVEGELSFASRLRRLEDIYDELAGGRPA